MSLGAIDVSRHSLEYALTQKGAGHSVVIVVGGQAEILDVRFDSYVLTLKRRKGFIKLALQTGLVWVFVSPVRKQMPVCAPFIYSSTRHK